jgi:hypothetical protein
VEIPVRFLRSQGCEKKKQGALLVWIEFFFTCNFGHALRLSLQLGPGPGGLGGRSEVI